MELESFTQRVSRLANSHPNRTILKFRRYGEPVECYSYRELIDRASLYRKLYQDAGLGNEDVVLIFLPQGPDAVCAFLGAILMGAVPSFMPSQTDRQDPELFWSTQNKLFRHIEPGAVITQQRSSERVSRMLRHTAVRILTDEQVPDSVVSQIPTCEASLESLLLLQHSSGTTGLKKGVMLSHGAVMRQLDLYSGALDATPEDCIVSWLPLYHDMGLVACLLLSLSQGIPLVLLDPFEWVLAPMMLFESIEEDRGTLVWLPNFAFNHLARAKSGDARNLSSVRAYLNCSEPCRASSFELFLEEFADWGVQARQLQVCYAMAEMVYAATQTSVGEPPCYLWVDSEQLADGLVQVASPGSSGTTPLVSNGKPLPTVQVRIAEEDGSESSASKVGEILLKSDFMFSGYYKMESSRFTSDGWYRTRDMGFVHKGDIYVLGRLDDLIIVCGKNLYAHSVETGVSEVVGVHPGRVVAFGIDDEDMSTKQLVVIAETKCCENEYRAIQDRIMDHIVAVHDVTPHTVKVVGSNWIVKTTSGKVSREANQKKFQQDKGLQSSRS